MLASTAPFNYLSNVVYLLAVGSAVLYGAADFLGGVTSRRASSIAIVVVSQLAGMLVLAVMLPFLAAGFPGRADLAWGASAGLFGGIGVATLYRALAVGTMALVAPTTAVCAVAIPVMAGILLGERPSAFATAGILLAIVAIVLVSRPRTPRIAAGRAGLPPGIGLALVSGVAIGLFFLSLARTSPAAGMWPLLVARIVSVTLFGAIAVAGHGTLRMARPVLLTAIAGGILDMLANALYLVAVREGPLAGVVTVSSMYPASTVVLARVVLGERLSRTQTAGIVCALAAVALIVRE